MAYFYEEPSRTFGAPNGKLLGIVASRDYRVNHTPDDACVTTFMTPRGLQADRRGHILRRGIAGDQQVLAKGAGGFFVEISHNQTPFLLTHPIQISIKIIHVCCL